MTQQQTGAHFDAQVLTSQGSSPPWTASAQVIRSPDERVATAEGSASPQVSGTPDWLPRVVVAIDFGTHGTGFAWATVSSLQDVASHREIVYQRLTSFGGASYPKDLSAVLVDANEVPLKFGVQARDRWERALNAGNPERLGYAARFKMAINPGTGEVDVPEFAGCLADRANDRDLVKRLVAATLGHVRALALADLGRTAYRGKIGFTADDVRWCLTVPAIWGDQDKQLMRAAAQDAGLPDDEARLLLVREPEAAAVHCATTAGPALDDTHRGEARLSVDATGSRFMVVDCGGGTVDITAFQVRPKGVGEGRLGEVGIANGGRLGSEYINQAFVDDLLADRFGRRDLAELVAWEPAGIAEMRDAWETQKVRLECETDATGKPVIVDPIYINIPGSIWGRLPESTRQRLVQLAEGATYKIVVTPAEVTGLFDSVVAPTLANVETQVAHMRTDSDAQADQIIVVGGFARSAYLRERLAHHFRGRAPVLIAQDPAVAVLAGAVHFAYNPEVIWGRRSRYTYGYDVAELFRPGKDPDERQFPDDDGIVWCKGRFGVMVRRGDTVATDELKIARLQIINRATAQFEIGLYATSADDPQYVDEPGAERIGFVKADVSKSVGSPSHERLLTISFAFGKTEIEVQTKGSITDVIERETIEFDELYGRRHAR
jgi:molecular chaperone DnaK (HSP70)